MDGGLLKSQSIMKIDLTADLPVLTRDYVALCNRLSSGKLEVGFTLAGKTVTLCHALMPRRDLAQGGTRVTLSNGKELATADVDFPLLETLLKSSDFDQDISSWSKDTTALVQAHFLNPLLDKMPSAGGTWRVAPDAEPTKPAASEINFTLSSALFPGGSAILSFTGEAAAMEQLLALLESQIARPATTPALAIEEVLSWRSPTFLMPIGIVEKCRTGDVVLLDPDWPGHTESVVWLGQALSAPVSFGGDEEEAAEPDDWLEEATSEDTFAFGDPTTDPPEEPVEGMTLGDGFKPTNPEITAQPEEMFDMSVSSKSAHGLNDLSVTLSVEFDRMTKPLAEIKDLDAGAVLPFDNAAPETVRLMANGKPFADGELVRIEDRIGVRLTRMA